MSKNVETSVGVGLAEKVGGQVSEDPSPSPDLDLERARVDREKTEKFNQMGESANKFLLGLVELRLFNDRVLALLALQKKESSVVVNEQRPFWARLFLRTPSPVPVHPSASVFDQLQTQLKVSFSQIFLEPGSKPIPEEPPIVSLRNTIDACIKVSKGTLVEDLSILDQQLRVMESQWNALCDAWGRLYVPGESADDSKIITSKRPFGSPLQLWKDSCFDGIWDFLNLYRRSMRADHVPAFREALRQQITDILLGSTAVSSVGVSRDTSGVLDSLFD